MNFFKRSSITCLVFGIALIMIAGCQSNPVETGGAGTDSETSASDETGDVTTIETPEAEVESASEDDSASLSGVQQVVAVRATEKLAAELGLSASDINITSVESVDWPDASLGCPEEGMMYASVLTSGYRITLDADGQQYEYHSSDRENSQVVRCEPDTGS